jgi:SRSO17 transposase
LKNYCTGLLLPGERKSVEPMAARLAPDHVRRMHPSLHHLMADAPWDDQELLEHVRQQVLAAMQKHSSVVAWIVDDTGFPKQGHVAFEFADRVALIPAGSVVPGGGTL